MRILSRYLIRQFLLVLLFGIIAFVAIFVIINSIESLDTFIDRGVPASLVVRYYLYYVPYIAVLTLPVAMLLASLFSVGQLARNFELSAMKASGISLYRALAPLLWLSLGVSLVVLVFGEEVVPVTTGKAVRIKKGRTDAGASRANVFLRDEGGAIVSVRYYDAVRRLGRDVDISVGAPRQAQIAKRVVAKKMTWKDGGWVLTDGSVREFVGDLEVVSAFDSTRADHLISFAPRDFAKQQKLPEEMDYFELRAYIDKVRRSGADATKWAVESHLKLSFPFANLIIVLFGAPLSSTLRRTGKAFGFGLSVAICFIYWATIKTGQALGWNGVLPPFAAAWIGNVVFGTLGAVLLIKVPK